MTLEAIYFIAQIIAAVAIVSSLVFVGFQVHANTREQRVATSHMRTERAAAIQRQIVSDPGLRDILIKSNTSYDELNASERMALNAYWQQYCMYIFDVRAHHELGVIGAPAWENHAFTFRRVCGSPGARRWWRDRGAKMYSDRPKRMLEPFFDPPAQEAEPHDA